MSACDPPPRTTELTAVQPCEVSMQDAMVVARPGPGGKRALSLLPMSPPGRVLESRELSVSCTCPVRFIKGVLCASLIHFRETQPFFEALFRFHFCPPFGGPFSTPPIPLLHALLPCSLSAHSSAGARAHSSLLCWRSQSQLRPHLNTQEIITYIIQMARG